MEYAIKLGYIKKDEQEEYTYGLDLIMSIICTDNENDTAGNYFWFYV